MVKNETDPEPCDESQEDYPRNEAEQVCLASFFCAQVPQDWYQDKDEYQREEPYRDKERDGETLWEASPIYQFKGDEREHQD